MGVQLIVNRQSLQRLTTCRYQISRPSAGRYEIATIERPNVNAHPHANTRCRRGARTQAITKGGGPSGEEQTRGRGITVLDLRACCARVARMMYEGDRGQQPTLLIIRPLLEQRLPVHHERNG